MTSSMYPLDVILANDSVDSIVIDDPGTGYTSTPTVTIDAPTSGTTATGTAVINNNVINATTLTTPGSGYSDGEAITLSGGTGTGAAGIAVISGGIIQSISLTNRGSAYTAADALTVTGDTSTASDGVFTVDSVVASDGLSSITITEIGSGYTSVPSIAITGGGGANAAATAVLSISVDGNILSSDITITRDMVKPGGGGILRVYFSLIFDSTPATVAVFNNGTFKGNLNADNDAQVITDGYYRFDIDVEEDDNINFQCSTDTVLTVNFFRAHLVQFGA